MPNPKISILVDYAHESASLKRVLETLSDWRRRQCFDKIIHIVSDPGVGRDDWKKPLLGSISYSNADFTIVSTDDYDASDDPSEIVRLISQNYPTETENKKIENLETGQKWHKEIDRDKAMQKALIVANQLIKSSGPETKILILSTGVGCAQTMSQPSGEKPRDERTIWRKLWNEYTLKI